jgi:hypothetical protein
VANGPQSPVKEEEAIDMKSFSIPAGPAEISLSRRPLPILTLVLAGALLTLSALVLPGTAGANHEGLQRELRELRQELQRGNDEQEFRDSKREWERKMEREWEREHERRDRQAGCEPGYHYSYGAGGCYR